MDTVELEKLHWTQDLPPLRRQQTQEVRRAHWPTGVQRGGSEWSYCSWTQNSDPPHPLSWRSFSMLTPVFLPGSSGQRSPTSGQRSRQGLSPERPGITVRKDVRNSLLSQCIVLFLYPLEDAGPFQSSGRAAGPRHGPSHPSGSAPPWRGGRGEARAPRSTGQFSASAFNNHMEKGGCSAASTLLCAHSSS